MFIYVPMCVCVYDVCRRFISQPVEDKYINYNKTRKEISMKDIVILDLFMNMKSILY